MSNEKMTSFSVVRKKTPFQKHREEEEAKKKRADEEAARLYEEFVESFKADDVPGGKAFVRGGTINQGDVKKTHGPSPHPAGPRVPPVSEGPTGKETEVSIAKKSGSRYVPSFIPPGLATMVNKENDTAKRAQREEEKNKDRDRGKSRNIDHFMEELKREQEAREKRMLDREHRQDGRPSRMTGIVTTDLDADNLTTRFNDLPEDFDPTGKLPGSFDDGDPQTTNLYVGNLSPQVDENFLLRTFGRFGPIASVKIMWPRTEEERRRQRNCGFVAFMNRGEAQAAKDEMQGIIVYEYELRIGWGKAVALPAQALPAPPPGQMAVRPKEGATAVHVAWSGPGVPPVPPAASGQNGEVVVTPNVPDIQVIPPEDDHMRHIIDTTAMYVLDDGCAFEQAIMERGRGNTLFSFLFDLCSAEHTYYIWRLYSFAQGDTLQRWRTEPFIMITGSGRWIPPPLPLQEFGKSPEREKASGTTFAAGRAKRLVLERALTEGQRDEFEDMLRALTLERSQIQEAMGFALDNSEAAGEVVEVLTESLTLLETPIPTKVARLMLVSDVLHNSSAPVKNASAYRTCFESRLPDIMESFNDLYRNITGRITAEALKERVLKVLQVWADWFLFSDAYVNGLRATFLRPRNSGVSPFHTLVGDAVPTKENGGEIYGDSENFTIEVPDGGQDAALAIGEGAAAKELASLPLAELERRCRHNGLSIWGGREVMVARLLSLEEAEKQINHEPEKDLKVLKRHGVPGNGVAVKTGELGMFRMREDSQWSSTGGWTEVENNWEGKVDDMDLGDGLRNDQRQALVLEEKTAASGVRWPQYDGEVHRSKDRNTGHSLSRPVLPTSTQSEQDLKSFGSNKEKLDRVLPASKWMREDNVSDEDEKVKGKGLGLGYSSSGSDEMFGNSSVVGKQGTQVENIVGAANDPSLDEERRQKLRKLEVAVMEYRESLEEQGIKSSEDIEVKVSSHRKKLEISLGLSGGPPLSSSNVDSKLGNFGSERSSKWSSDNVSSDGRDKRDERREHGSSKKGTRNNRSRSRSPSGSRDRSNRDKVKEQDRERGGKGSRGWVAAEKGEKRKRT